jgi:GNAT superfamily N-acetyltransferase
MGSDQGKAIAEVTSQGDVKERSELAVPEVAGMGTVHMVMLTGHMAEAMQADPNSCFALIANMAVHPSARGRGVGRALLRSCEQKATETFRPRPWALLMLVRSMPSRSHLLSRLVSDWVVTW